LEPIIIAYPEFRQHFERREGEVSPVGSCNQAVISLELKRADDPPLFLDLNYCGYTEKSYIAPVERDS
jgi:hypothetical protein